LAARRKERANGVLVPARGRYNEPVGTDRTTRALVGLGVGSLGALGAAAALVGVRGEIANANVALVLVVFVLLGAVAGGRAAGATSALVAAAAFDFFHTHPYNSLKMTDGNEVFTTFLLLAVGLVVGEIAVRSQTIHALRTDHRAQLRRINRIAGLAAKGELVDDLLLAVTAELIDTLRLRDAYFERPPYLAGFPRLERNGVVGTRVHRYADGEFELPREGVELPVGAGEALLGRFVLVPTPGVGVSTERRLIAIALADQVGAVLGRKVA